MRLEAASRFDSAFLADLYTRGYEGYFVPVHVDAATVERIGGLWDVDLSRSRVAFEADEPVGFAYLAVRGTRAWIGGIGVVPTARRRDLAKLTLLPFGVLVAGGNAQIQCRTHSRCPSLPV